jgi:hypothetical protein
MVDKPNKPKKKVYSNEHPKYKDSKSYSEKEILEFNSAKDSKKEKEFNRTEAKEKGLEHRKNKI